MTPGTPKNMQSKPDPKPQRKRFWKFLTLLGPGLTTGAADDDPSGIATYSQTGAQFGYGQLWTALYMLPFMAAVQEACARIGLVTGKGIAAVVKEHYSKPVLYAVVSLVVIANTINIGADIGAMASAAAVADTGSFCGSYTCYYRYHPHARDIYQLQNLFQNIKVAGTGAAGLSHHGIYCAPALGNGT